MFINGVENQLISNFEINSLSEGEGSTQISEANAALLNYSYKDRVFKAELILYNISIGGN